MRTSQCLSTMAMALALMAFPLSALADESFVVSGTGVVNSSYEVEFVIDGDTVTIQIDASNESITPEEFVAKWKEVWDSSTEDQAIKDKFVDNLDGTFTLKGGGISVKAGDIGSTSEVVGNPNGVPFNPTLFNLSVPALSVQGVIAFLLLATGALFVIYRRRSRNVAG